ncbi:acidic fibroblast growth factor intracellular-binding protein B-like [Rhopilema esculentum]|uniref:acidic fibroblast growth factor intracellular-binding protein B-like n=1 Tax=Rhopilema esculentum TaxID=499914 RepID=UPI0031E19038
MKIALISECLISSNHNKRTLCYIPSQGSIKFQASTGEESTTIDFCLAPNLVLGLAFIRRSSYQCKMDEFSVCFSDPVDLDFHVYSLWLEGLNEEEATRQRKCMEPSLNFPNAILLSDTREQFQLFQLLEKFLQSPLTFRTQMLCALSQTAQQELIQKYYSFDKDVIREILGRKMSAKLRKDMDDVSEKTGIPLKRCRRQFDNVKNVLKAYEDGEGSALDIMQRQFLVTEPLASIYASLVFIFVNRFETGRKRLLYLNFDDFVFCAEQMLKHWCVGDILCYDDDLDRNFFQEIRDLKNLISDKEINDQLKNTVVSHLENENHVGLAKSVDACFRSISQKIFHIGSSMPSSREVREFFNHSVEKIIEPIKQLEWSKHEFELFLDALINCEGGVKPLMKSSAPPKTGSSYCRFLKPMKECLLQMYHT